MVTLFEASGTLEALNSMRANTMRLMMTVYIGCRAIPVVAFLVVALLGACGGRGGGDNNTSTTGAGASNWDQMVWDQDNWG